jgi:Cu-Zn family superoxide dismutase
MIAAAAGTAVLTACSSSAGSTGSGSTSPTASASAAGSPAASSASPYGSSAVPDPAGTEVARADLAAPDGRAVGTVSFRTSPDDATKLVVHVSAQGLAPGFKGFHVHGIGKCEPNSPDPANPGTVGDFLSAGGHLKAGGENHAGHDGDLTSLQVRSDGSAELVTSTDALPLAALLDADGSAAMVHLGPDNFGNIPTRYAPTPDATTLNTGDSGGRAACGVIEAG